MTGPPHSGPIRLGETEERGERWWRRVYGYRAPDRERFTLRARIGVLAALVAAAMVLIVSAAAFLVVRQNLTSSLDETLQLRAQAAAESDLINPQLLAALPPAVLGAADLHIALVYASGVYTSADPTSMPPVDGPELAVAQGEEKIQPGRTASLEGVPYRVVAVPAGEGRALVIAQQLDTMTRVVSRLGTALPLVGLGGVVLAALAGVAVARTGLRPVQRLTAATERVANTGDLRPIPVSGSDELARLTISFNAMLGALAASREQQRRLVADAGHELRTPLTSLRTNLELLAAADRPDTPDLPADDRVELLGDVRAQVEELSHLVGDLVELARDDAPTMATEALELGEVVERALARVRRRAGEVEFDVHLTRWTLDGDANALERAVLNLLDNAVKWSPPGGTVRLSMVPISPEWLVVEVADAGDGIAAEDLPHVFDRFYRADLSRTMPGSGLGLSIVAQAAARHGGEVRAGRAPEGGALLSMALPGRHVDGAGSP
ncbi:Osmosensitive K+ channel histidine kinase KdpD [Pseudonocardia sp. Ae168_Ps1]|uniref:sensor histidine kinase n=1 Tax=unclassified Pseudonocardia TaxID=2619320 RepID=UPI0009672C2E|nr:MULTISPECIES: HAMP domain-containing sensor histidine kinase [unclassified Pseudonocardia]OLL75577.1 Osmosensitive K+ channel histidine kinase KdpD [Pseudonocardia sp. Ae150A_Ps1]OLL81572.1 Osmosensitive K+ channel histidine kinase KdpD [Pseudonocardia sp. Ae168_Ps1]OLL84315.1 Osmosensitive K+ channel histidine kinase KdpD [Pseudonocardia sp. Ae263_Ps1]OLL95667.1 Osmosensitive K+ channel histidine kinase KdpD [Pseudonocardia sp. Ae356_Ps1]